jgi:hypothetical protein
MPEHPTPMQWWVAPRTRAGRTLAASALIAIFLTAAFATPALAAIEPYPATFHTEMVPTNGTRLYVRVGGKGPAVVPFARLR